jgi:DnaJ-class molecular chaperone
MDTIQNGKGSKPRPYKGEIYRDNFSHIQWDYCKICNECDGLGYLNIKSHICEECGGKGYIKK